MVLENIYSVHLLPTPNTLVLWNHWNSPRGGKLTGQRNHSTSLNSYFQRRGLFKLKSSSRNGGGIFSTTTRKRVKPPWLFVKLMVRGGGLGGGGERKGGVLVSFSPFPPPPHAIGFTNSLGGLTLFPFLPDFYSWPEFNFTHAR